MPHSEIFCTLANTIIRMEKYILGKYLAVGMKLSSTNSFAFFSKTKIVLTQMHKQRIPYISTGTKVIFFLFMISLFTGRVITLHSTGVCPLTTIW